MYGIVLEIQIVLYKVVVRSRPFLILLCPYVRARRQGLGYEASFLCVDLCLTIQNLMCKVVVFGLFFC